MDISGTEQELNAQVALALLLRKTEVGFTFQRLGSDTNINVRTLKRLLHGETEIGISDFARISRAMGREPDEILAAIRHQAENSPK